MPLGTVNGMNVIDAVNKRMSVRDFLDTPVDPAVLRALVEDAARAPSGGNVQPWRIYVLDADGTRRMREYMATEPPVEAPEYDIYPKDLQEPYRTNRFAIGEQMYATLGIARDDKAARFAQMGRNLDFFGAPAAVFCFVERNMGLPQWSDLGMYLQTLMLLAVERGLGTCAQEFWSIQHKAVSTFCGAPENEMLFCGVALGHVNESAPVNTLRSERMPFEGFARFV